MCTIKYYVNTSMMGNVIMKRTSLYIAEQGFLKKTIPSLTIYPNAVLASSSGHKTEPVFYVWLNDVQPMGEDVTYVTSSLIGWELIQ